MASGKLLPILRKSHKFLKKSSAGRHKSAESMPLLALLRDVLAVAASKREAKTILTAGDVLVDGVIRRDEGFPVGLMDIVALPKLGLNFRIAITGGKLSLQPISAAEAGVKLCKVVGKKLVSGGRIQLSFHDGRSHLTEKEEDRFSLGDTVKLGLPKQSIKGFLKLEKGAKCYVHAGKHAGETAVLDKILERAGSTSNEVRLKSADGREIVTRKDYVLVVDDSFTLKK